MTWFSNCDHFTYKPSQKCPGSQYLKTSCILNHPRALCVCVITEIKSAFSLLGPNHEESDSEESHFPIKFYHYTDAASAVHEFWNNGQEQCRYQKFSQPKIFTQFSSKPFSIWVEFIDKMSIHWIQLELRSAGVWPFFSHSVLSVLLFY